MRSTGKGGGVNFGTGGVIAERTKNLKNVRNRRLGRAKQQISLVPMQISRKKLIKYKNKYRHWTHTRILLSALVRTNENANPWEPKPAFW